MANFLQPSIVNYVCGCGNLGPITKLYFCRHCLKLRCGFCVCHEVDSHFCCKCFENIPSSEAKLKKNRCNSCFDCPSCQHLLSARATTVQVTLGRTGKTDDDKSDAGSTVESSSKSVTRKMYYLACLSCRWTSRDVGIPDQTSATGLWAEPEYAHATRFALLMEHYQNVVLQEKQEKQDFMRRKAPKQQKYPSLTDRTGVMVSMVRRQIGWADTNTPKMHTSTINPSTPTDIVEKLPENIFTQPVNLKNVTTIGQRLSQPASQPCTVKTLFPQHKQLSIKTSLRCRQCEHNVIKAEYNPISIKYRIQLVANYHVPEIRLMQCDKLQVGHSTQFLLKVINPTMHDMTITIMDLPTPEEETLLIEEMKKSFEKQITIGGIGGTDSIGTTTPIIAVAHTFSRQSSLNEEPRYVDKRVTATLTLPDSSFIVHHRDDTAEFDDDNQMERDDPKFITSRRSNKVAIQLTVNPMDCKTGDDIVIGFSMQYTYVNTVTNAIDKKEPQKHALNARVYIKLGQIE